MTQAQKTAKAKFKQAIAYRQKTGVSLKEAFAHIYGKKTATKKKAAKKVIRKKAAKKKIGALPIGFSGNIWGIKFKIVNQYDIYGNVAAIVENIETGHRIVTFDGVGSANEIANVFSGYIERHGTGGSTNSNDLKLLKSRLLKFCTVMQKEVKEFNSGKKKTIKKQPLSIPLPKHKKTVVKKVAKKSIKKHTHWGTVHTHKRRVNGVGAVKKSATTMHKDTKSHNVNIRVMSGVDSNITKQLNTYKGLIRYYTNNIEIFKDAIKKRKERGLTPMMVSNLKKDIKKFQSLIKEYKIHLTQLKKHI
jgi:hypothetical protein